MNFKKQNEEMVRKLVNSGALKTPKIIDAFKEIPRYLFMTEEHLHIFYVDVALATIKNSTISQPTTVAMMTEALQPKGKEKILEIGAGSGWQACILAFCSKSVITIEIDEDVYNFAKENIKKTKLKNIKLILGDGSMGYEEEAPYNKIIITAGCPEIPLPIKNQLKTGGRIVSPIGFENQQMVVTDKISENKYSEEDIGLFSFVPLKGKFGFKE
jgi:protein-L-isoaspartate(D-aspartate) O-methyltransferase